MKLEKHRKKIAVAVVSAAVLAVIIGVIIRSCAFGGYNYSGEPYVCLDAGHGADDVGAVLSDRYEKDDNLTLTLKVSENLEKMGIKTYLTRSDDSDVTLRERCKAANKNKCTLFISIHRNSAESNKACGVEAWVSKCAKGGEEDLATELLENICKVTGQQNRGVKHGFRDNVFGDYYVNSDTNMPSLLLEVGFITNEDDNKVFDEKLDETAQAIAKTIYDSIMNK